MKKIQKDADLPTLTQAVLSLKRYLSGFKPPAVYKFYVQSQDQAMVKWKNCLLSITSTALTWLSFNLAHESA